MPAGRGTDTPFPESHRCGVSGIYKGDRGWDKDLALDLLNDLLDQLGLDDALLGELVDALGEVLFDDLNAGPGDQVINTTFTTTSGTLPPPPPPPPF